MKVAIAGAGAVGGRCLKQVRGQALARIRRPRWVGGRAYALQADVGTPNVRSPILEKMQHPQLLN